MHLYIMIREIRTNTVQVGPDYMLVKNQLGGYLLTAREVHELYDLMKDHGKLTIRQCDGLPLHLDQVEQ